MTTNKYNYQSGFTVVELLIVFAVIGILAALVFNSVRDVQASAREATAERTLQDIESGVFKLAIDTSKWPNGCTPDQVSQPEADVDQDIAGLLQAPPVGIITSDCQWSTSEVAAWQGPYIEDDAVNDPWDNPYVFDPDYYAYNNCSEIANEPVQAAVVSYGPDGTRYTCDDIFRVMTD